MNKTIGYTTGVYDLFHIGHLNLIKNAKEHCDFLIVGITTDELSLSVKGRQPIVPYAERMEIVSSLKYVDKVVPQEVMDKFVAWEKYGFSKMFVGDDWRGTEKWIFLEKKFREVEVEIIYFPYTLHTSSTFLRNVLEKI